MQDEKLTEKVLQCPHCQKMITVVVRTQIEQILPWSGDASDPLACLTDAQKKTVEVAKQAGILDMFEEVVRIANAGQIPRSMERFFVTFLRTAVTKVIPRFALDFFLDRFAARHVRDLQFWVAQ